MTKLAPILKEISKNVRVGGYDGSRRHDRKLHETFALSRRSGRGPKSIIWTPAMAKHNSRGSYNHADSTIADQLKAALEQRGIEVCIDKAVMGPGTNIQEFIERSIHDTDVTLSIVSNRSLLSAWVALETINTFYHETFQSNKKFIACYIDDDFFGTDFRLNATK